MRKRSLALAVLSAAFAGIAATAPSASAAGSSACPDGNFCLWPTFASYPTPVETPVLVTSGDWSGHIDGLVFQNTGSRAVDVEYTTYMNDGTVPVDGTVCVTRDKFSRQFFYNPTTVHKVTWRADNTC
ncbi:hypothetical protein [Streptomyces rhizosphaericus]|uniref:Peptidase inhibitor family I36 protein n=1 Tax=Streptomyces rhizosphaericus TaxID=114699 RepID=A0A6G4AI31_9ACTN|nr:hypothetical protein [Streptomyces rhizosphaericus]NEW72900.1 hypothetical protein [Streptomyces rhizosphaericus]